MTPEQFDAIYHALPADAQLLVETDIETGLRWGELTELRPPTSIRHPDAHRQPRRHRHHRPLRRRPIRRQGLPQGQGIPPAQAQPRPMRRARRAHRERQLRPRRAPFPFALLDETADRRRPNARPCRHRGAEPTGRTEPNRGPDLPARHPHRLLARPMPLRALPDAFATTAPSAAPPARTTPAVARIVDTDGHVPRNWFRYHIWSPASAAAASTHRSASTTSATPTPPGYSPAAPTSRPSRNASATAAFARPRNTSTPSPTPTTPHSTHSNAPETAHHGRCCTSFASASAASAHTRPYRQAVTAEGLLPTRALFGHCVELPSSPCIAGGNTSGVKLRRPDGARASEGTASRPRDAAGSDPASVAVGPFIDLPARASASACLTTCRATLQLSQLTSRADPRGRNRIAARSGGAEE